MATSVRTCCVLRGVVRCVCTGGNPSANRIYEVSITLIAGTLTMTIDGVVHSSRSVASVCANGGCEAGGAKMLYFCNPTSADQSCANTEIRNLRYGPI